MATHNQSRYDQHFGSGGGQGQYGGGQYGQYGGQYGQKHQQLTHQVAKTTTAVTLGGSLMVLSGLTLAATVIGLVLATPLLVIFSPVLLPAAITLFLITAGFVTSGGFGATASFLFYWMYRYATGKHPIGADQLDRAREKLTHAAYDVKDKAEHQFGQQGQGQHYGGQHYGTGTHVGGGH